MPPSLPAHVAAQSVLGERYYKVVAEGLRVAERLVRTMRPTAEQPLPPSLKVVMLLHTRPLHFLNPIRGGTRCCLPGPPS